MRVFWNDVIPDTTAQAVLVGMPGLAQKFTIQLTDRTGQVVAYVKYADKPAALTRLEKEASLLRKLPPGCGPTPLGYQSFGNAAALVLNAVPGLQPRVALPPPFQLHRFSASLLSADSHALESHPWVVSRASLPAEIDQALGHLCSQTWPATMHHGDLAPWNLVHNVVGGLTAIDWEYGHESGFPGLDLAQYVLQLSALIYRWSPKDARAVAIRQLLQAPYLSISHDQARSIVALAAYEAFCNTFADGHHARDPLQAWRREIWKRAS